MNKEKLDALRAQIPLPLNKAIEALNKNNWDVDACVEEFHTNNINEIRRVTECDEATAQSNYKACNQNVAKAIQRIFDQVVYISTWKESPRLTGIGFVLWPDSKGKKHSRTGKREDVFIATYDFDFIEAVFRSVYPLTDPYLAREENSFDITGYNRFDRTTILVIAEKIGQLTHDDPVVLNFFKEVQQWLIDNSTKGEYIVVLGTL